MEINSLVGFWVTTPVILIEDYEEMIYYTNKRYFRGNIQENFSELELKIYGEILNQMQKIYTETSIDIKAGDNIYFSEPITNGQHMINDELVDTYNKGEAVAEKPKSSYIGVNRLINPTYTNIRFNAV